MTSIKGKLTKGTFAFDSITTGAIAVVGNIFTASRDDDSLYTTSPDARFVAKRNGLYTMYFRVRISYFPGFDDNSSCTMRILVNGAAVEGADTDTSVSRIAAGALKDYRIEVCVTWTAALVPGDYIQLQANRNATAGAHDTMTEFAIAWMPGAS